MKQYLYLSLVPEALIVSMLDPKEFASYYATGTQSKIQGQALIIEVDPAFRTESLPIDKGIARSVPHKDGSPKRSVYVSVYRVLERIPLSAMGTLRLVTRDGRSLGIEKKPAHELGERGLHLYHELAPTHPAVVSTLDPADFFELLMGRSAGFEGLPALAFLELRLGALAQDPINGDTGDLPYENMPYLRNCLAGLKNKTIGSKIFDRSNPGLFPYRTLKTGVFIGNADEGLSLYPLPPLAELKEKHFDWYKSANL